MAGSRGWPRSRPVFGLGGTEDAVRECWGGCDARRGLRACRCPHVVPRSHLAWSTGSSTELSPRCPQARPWPGAASLHRFSTARAQACPQGSPQGFPEGFHPDGSTFGPHPPWPGLFRPSMSVLLLGFKSWMLGTRPGMTSQHRRPSVHRLGALNHSLSTGLSTDLSTGRRGLAKGPWGSYGGAAGAPRSTVPAGMPPKRAWTLAPARGSGPLEVSSICIRCASVSVQHSR